MGTGWLVITPQLTYTQAILGAGHQSRLGEKPACETKRRKNRGREVKILLPVPRLEGGCG